MKQEKISDICMASQKSWTNFRDLYKNKYIRIRENFKIADFLLTCERFLFLLQIHSIEGATCSIEVMVEKGLTSLEKRDVLPKIPFCILVFCGNQDLHVSNFFNKEIRDKWIALMF